MIEAYPLYWPEGRKKTAAYSRESARFDTTFARARDNVVREVELLCGKYSHMQKEAGLIVSTNIALRRDGLPLANQRQPEDTGVAVYFNYKKTQVCFACDRWKKIEDNMQAIAKTIEALRGIARWGTGDMMEAAFKGFVALPAPDVKRTWREVMGFVAGEPVDAETLRIRYRKLASNRHPDKDGGTHDAMVELNAAYEQAEKEISNG
jgi:hypothetical protein